MITYLDTNVLLYAFAVGHPRQKAAHEAILQCAGESRLATSFLTIDEFIWSLRRVLPYPTAVETAHHILGLPLEILSIGPKEGIRALTFMRERNLRPHDATHAAVALEHGCRRILSTDSDFDRVEGLERIALDS